MTRFPALIVPVALIALAAACAPARPDIRVTDAFVRPALDSAIAGFTIANRGGADRLVAISAPGTGPASLHVTSGDGGVMRMRALPSVDVDAGARVDFAPGGRHVMIMPLARPLKVGTTVRLELRFERQGLVAIDAPVVALAAPAHGGH